MLTLQVLSEDDYKSIHFQAEDGAYRQLEGWRWPDGRIVCPHCNSTRIDHYYLVGVTGKTGARRFGVRKCVDCRKQFSATVNTPLHGAHLSLDLIFRTVRQERTGMSILGISQVLDLNYPVAYKLVKLIRANPDFFKLIQ